METIANPGILCALLACTIATACDLKTKRIPNLPLIVFFSCSLILAILEKGIVSWTLNVITASILFYLVWLLGAWGAGDSKLFIVIAALTPEYPPTSLGQKIPFDLMFYLTVFFNFLAVYLIYLSLRMLVHAKKKNKLTKIHPMIPPILITTRVFSAAGIPGGITAIASGILVVLVKKIPLNIQTGLMILSIASISIENPTTYVKTLAQVSFASMNLHILRESMEQPLPQGACISPVILSALLVSASVGNLFIWLIT